MINERNDALEALRRTLANLLTTEEYKTEGGLADGDDAQQCLDRLIEIARNIGPQGERGKCRS